MIVSSTFEYVHLLQVGISYLAKAREDAIIAPWIGIIYVVVVPIFILLRRTKSKRPSDRSGTISRAHGSLQESDIRNSIDSLMRQITEMPSSSSVDSPDFYLRFADALSMTSDRVLEQERTDPYGIARVTENAGKALKLISGRLKELDHIDERSIGVYRFLHSSLQRTAHLVDSARGADQLPHMLYSAFAPFDNDLQWLRGNLRKWRDMRDTIVENLSTVAMDVPPPEDPQLQDVIPELQHAFPIVLGDLSNGQSVWFNNWRAICSDSLMLRDLAHWMVRIFQSDKREIDAVCSLSITGLPLATHLADLLARPLYAADNRTYQMLYDVPERKRVLLVDSIIVTGHHIKVAETALMAKGSSVECVVCVIQVLDPRAMQLFAVDRLHTGDRYYFPFKSTDLLDRFGASLWGSPHAPRSIGVTNGNH